MDGHWILLGMMGAGKSTVGKALAANLGIPFRDTDAILQNRLGRTISQMFRLYGEEAFREHETSVLRSLEREEGILATGGGIILRDENWVEFHRLGKTVFLDVDPEFLKGRLAQSRKKRPLLEREDWRDAFDSLLADRRERYLKADVVVKITDAPLEEVAEKVAARLQEEA